MDQEKETTISFNDLLKVFTRRWWLIALASVIGAIVGFVLVLLVTEQTWKASCMVYVNNNNFNIGSVNLSMSDISANRSLVDSYSVIIKSRGTIDTVIDQTETNLDYDYDTLSKLIVVGSVNNTEIFSVSVTCPDEADSINLANEFFRVIEDKVPDIIEGTSVKLVDPAVIAEPVSRGFTKSALIGFLIGFVVICAIVFVNDLFIDDTIDSADWIKQTFGDEIPLLAIVPDTSVENHKGSYYRKHGYYQNYYDTSKKDSSNSDDKVQE
ncbi:hypothetical protein J6Y73_00840 [bacterium]|nr:hypothetical protein [bacterium]